MIQDPNASAVGPTASMVVDFRLDDAALKTVMTKDKLQLQNAVVTLMEATQLERTAADTTAERTKIRTRSLETAKKMADQFATYSDQYKRLLSIDGARIDTLGQIGGNAIEVRFSVDSSNRADYDKAVSQSVAQARAGVVSKMYDALRTVADDMPSSGGSSAAHPEQIASFALLSMAPGASTELRVNFRTDNSSCGLCGSRDRYDAAGFATFDKYAKGPQATPIAAGLFDIDAIISAPQ
jgi:hypothetical protein